MKKWAEKFYAGKAWESTRRAYLKSKDYLCERCLKRGMIVRAKIVHHRTYLTEKNINDPDIALNHDNLEALCHECHNEEHIKTHRRYRFGDDGAISPLFKQLQGGEKHRGGEVKKPVQGERGRV